MPYHIVMTSSAKMPSSCMGTYRNVAVVRVEDGCPAPKIITNTKTAKVVRHYGPRNVGKTARCAYEVTLAEAEALADELNRENKL